MAAKECNTEHASSPALLPFALLNGNSDNEVKITSIS